MSRSETNVFVAGSGSGCGGGDGDGGEASRCTRHVTDAASGCHDVSRLRRNVHDVCGFKLHASRLQDDVTGTASRVQDDVTDAAFECHEGGMHDVCRIETQRQ